MRCVKWNLFDLRSQFTAVAKKIRSQLGTGYYLKQERQKMKVQTIDGRRLVLEVSNVGILEFGSRALYSERLRTLPQDGSVHGSF